MSTLTVIRFQGAAGKDGPAGSTGDLGAKVTDKPNAAYKLKAL